MRTALAALLAAALLAPAAAVAQTPFQPLPAAPPQQTTPAAPAQGTGDDGITPLQQGLLIFAGIALVLGIGIAIARDARRNAPAERPPIPGGVTAATPDGERRRPDPRAAQKQKAAAKRARQARKKNRPVRK